ncbi:DUF1515 family protein [Rhizobium sp. 007]|uniref:DUF1515 family protein n=1 Tax=Rhizobium sp. 007 TaxID=2785056 RepID=UPI0024850C0E|nr:DUF1515 family protein [Rhizobium sp. 007]
MELSIAQKRSAISGSVTTIQEDLPEMRKVTDDVQRWKLMGIGALADIGIGGADAIRRIGRLFLDGSAIRRRPTSSPLAFTSQQET